MPSNVEHVDLSETEKRQMHFMANRLGFDHFIICGYDSTEFRKHVLSKGYYDFGRPKIGIHGSLAGVAYILAQILVDFEFSPKLRQGVYSIVSNFLEDREIFKKEQEDERKST